MEQLRDYQVNVANEAVVILRGYNIVYITSQVRTGKTLMSLETARLYGAKNVLFLTKKKAIKSIKSDYDKFNYAKYFDMTLINDESMHKIEGDFDLVIHDEHHRFGSAPRPSSRTKLYKKMYSSKPMIFLSGTPSPESYSQLYHQFWVSDYSPWKNYSTFYKWATRYVDVRQKMINGFPKNDYSRGREEMIMNDVKHLMISFTQKQAGFSTVINETVLYCDMPPLINTIIKSLLKDKIFRGKDEVILGDTGAKLRQKIHQLSGMTIKFESGNSMVLDLTKANYIREYFKGKRIGIFYVYKEELNAIKSVFGDEVTTDLSKFDDGVPNYAGQIVSSREGISLKNADYLVFYNISDSAVSYFQARDRLSTIDRASNDVFYVFTKGGIEDKIFRVVTEKKADYTNYYFKKDYGGET